MVTITAGVLLEIKGSNTENAPQLLLNEKGNNYT